MTGHAFDAAHGERKISIRNGDESVETHALQPAFYVADIGWRLVDDFREFLLREASTLSDLSDVFADLYEVDCHNKTSKNKVGFIIALTR